MTAIILLHNLCRLNALLPLGLVGVLVGFGELLLHALLEVFDASVDNSHVAQQHGSDQELLFGQGRTGKVVDRVGSSRHWLSLP